MEQELCRSCADCATKSCSRMDGKNPPFCLTTNLDEDLLAEAMACYQDPQINLVTQAAATVEADYYCQMTRVEEIMEFARRIGAKKLGIATCLGTLAEARIAARIFRHNGFEVFGAACKVGAQPKVSVGIPQRCEAIGVNMCNPILQAKLLNRQGTDLNVLVGLCVGHDSLFYRYSQALVTTLLTKDRVLGHNPAAALYQADGYYAKKLFPPKPEGTEK